VRSDGVGFEQKRSWSVERQAVFWRPELPAGRSDAGITFSVSFADRSSAPWPPFWQWRIALEL
jgi:hypothetical protein